MCGRTAITVLLSLQGSIKKLLCTILCADILQAVSKVFLEAGIPNSKKQPQTKKSVVENELFCALPVKCSSCQTITASSDCLLLVTEVSLSVYMLSRIKIGQL